MNLDNICIILDRPDESRNIGSACRAMANNGISCLRIVGKKSDYDDEKVRILAIHAYKIWENCRFYDSITEAISDCSIALGTTRRKGKKRRDKYYFPEEIAIRADSLTQQGARAAFVFGNERTGLTDDELNECTGAVTIPSSEGFASLNLSHAVQIICYHLFRQAEKTRTGFTGSGFTPISLERLDKTVDLVTDSLESIGFFKIAGKEDQKRFWKDILSRASLSEGETKYLEKIFTKAKGLSSK
ncbi:MAG: RNA methyltransferase [Treponema sp.]|uniref:RNA methyltransferase n=1 Tax=Treponema sp. TaxID=166 RepID=UPI001B652A47|nr:RNA methyltransferase [Treponema sp.]MBP5588732.1 RNA methyltransferase [Treponema sp.]MBR0155448.1 RNA methyltransferase [Treponema sp.]